MKGQYWKVKNICVDQSNNKHLTPDMTKPRAPTLDANPLKREGNLRNMSGGKLFSTKFASIKTTDDLIIKIR